MQICVLKHRLSYHTASLGPLPRTAHDSASPLRRPRLEPHAQLRAWIYAIYSMIIHPHHNLALALEEGGDGCAAVAGDARRIGLETLLCRQSVLRFKINILRFSSLRRNAYPHLSSSAELLTANRHSC